MAIFKTSYGKSLKVKESFSTKGGLIIIDGHKIETPSTSGELKCNNDSKESQKLN